MEHYGLHWFRRDLRVAGNPALEWSWKEHRGRVLGVFCFDRQFLSRPDFSRNRFGFFLETLAALRDELRSLGGDLLVLDVGPQAAFEELLTTLQHHHIPLPASVSINRDYEPFARERDRRMEQWLPKSFGIAIHTERDHLLIEPDELLRDNELGRFYQVYSPFAKRWFALANSAEVHSRITSQRRGLSYLDRRLRNDPAEQLLALTWLQLFGGNVPLVDHLDGYLNESRRAVTVALPPAGSLAALRRLREFRQSSLDAYSEHRDVPGIDGTSRLSIYLKNGSLTSAQVLAELNAGSLDFGTATGATKFIKEIVWREFYYHILYHRPDVEQHAFLPQFRNLPWENREDWFAAWQRGETGFPIVDAGMRQLAATGWMHNRVRMIVASFLTKDLLIDWRWGERHFMQHLLDGDLAPNNGGWQWAASTGCDPQPYFRIFNPELQSRKFDPEGDYIRQYVAELRDVPARFIHTPHASGEKLAYPPPIVDHRLQKERALALYRAAGERSRRADDRGATF